MARLTCLAVLFLLAALPLRAAADAYDPPANYYSTAFTPNRTLKENLNDIIDNHTVISYSALPDILGVTDDDPDPLKPNNLLTVYDRTSINKTYSTNPLIWNREHTWPRSRGVGDTGPDDSDLFNIRPALTEGNGDRANFNFGGVYNSQGAGLVTAPNPDEWYPGNADAGMIARQEFYMAVRYDGIDNASNTTNLELVSGNPAASQTAATLGDLDRLMEWHFAAVPDEFERRRNQIIYDNYQHNRDPFIDNPEWAWAVFMDNANDTGLTLSGGTAGAAGATTLNVDQGRRLVGSALPAGQAVTLNKVGLDGTYYSVTAAGASSSVTGKFNAFTMGGAGSKSITVGLAASTNMASPGLRSGMVTIDNLDITTAGGADRGANDGNDVVNISLSVLAHANASFAGASDVNSKTLDFGVVAQGAPSPTLPFGISNFFTAPATATFTAGLDLDGIAGSNATSVLTTDLATFSGATTLAAGLSKSFTAAMSTSSVGAFSATYTLSFSDENLPGATNLSALTLTLMGTVEAAPVLNADFDGSGTVDGGDLLAWQQGFGVTNASLSDGDANGDHIVDDADYATWTQQFGGPPPGFAAVPEPGGFQLGTLILAMATASGCRRPTRLAQYFKRHG